MTSMIAGYTVSAYAGGKIAEESEHLSRAEADAEFERLKAKYPSDIIHIYDTIGCETVADHLGSRYLVQSHLDCESIEQHLTDDLADAHKAFARMCEERKGSVVTIYDGNRYEYIATFRAGQKRHAITRELIDLILKPAGT